MLMTELMLMAELNVHGRAKC